MEETLSLLSLFSFRYPTQTLTALQAHPCCSMYQIYFFLRVNTIPYMNIFSSATRHCRQCLSEHSCTTQELNSPEGNLYSRQCKPSGVQELVVGFVVVVVCLFLFKFPMCRASKVAIKVNSEGGVWKVTVLLPLPVPLEPCLRAFTQDRRQLCWGNP